MSGSIGAFTILFPFVWDVGARVGDAFSGGPFAESDVAGGAVGIYPHDAGSLNGLGFGFRLGFGIGRRGGFRFMRFEVLFEEAIFALERAFGSVFVAEMEVVFFDLFRGPVERREAAQHPHVDVVIALTTEAMPLGLGGFEDEIVFERVFFGLVAMAPAVEEALPTFFRFGGEDEGESARAMSDSVFGGADTAFERSGAGAAAVTFFGRGIGGEIGVRFRGRVVGEAAQILFVGLDAHRGVEFIEVLTRAKHEILS
jgi:hypothetical protein